MGPALEGITGREGGPMVVPKTGRLSGHGHLEIKVAERYFAVAHESKTDTKSDN